MSTKVYDIIKRIGPITRATEEFMSTKDDERFRTEVARVLAIAISKGGLSRQEAAMTLQVSRQALHKYLRGLATPRSAVLSRACREWGVKFRYRDGEFGEEALRTPRIAKDSPSEQLDLFAAEALKTANFEVVRASPSRDGTIELQLRIKLAG